MAVLTKEVKDHPFAKNDPRGYKKLACNDRISLEDALYKVGMKYNEFLQTLEKNEIESVHLKGGQINLTDTFGRQFSTFSPESSCKAFTLAGDHIPFAMSAMIGSRCWSQANEIKHCVFTQWSLATMYPTTSWTSPSIRR